MTAEEKVKDLREKSDHVNQILKSIADEYGDAVLFRVFDKIEDRNVGLYFGLIINVAKINND